MHEKKTISQLEQRVRELEKETETYRQRCRVHHREHQQMLCLFNLIDTPIYVSDPVTFDLLFVNKSFQAVLNAPDVGDKCYRAIQGLSKPCPFCTNDLIFGKNLWNPYIWEFRNRVTNRYYRCINKAIYWLDGRIVRYEMATDITDSKRVEAALEQKEKELELKNQSLERIHTAFDVLLEHREKQKRKLEENVLKNVEILILPYIQKLEKARIDREHMKCIGIIKSNLNALVSPFLSRIASRYTDFTPMERKVADLVKNGQTSKEIASFLNVSVNDVSFHRANIRKKLKLTNKRTNLRSYLQTLSD